MEAVTDFLLLGSKITVDDYWSHGIRRRLLLGRKAMRNLDIMLKSRDITLPTNVCIVKAMVFPVVTDDCENWNVKKAEHQRIDAFELCCWRRLLRVSWTVRRSNPSILKDIDLEYSRKGLIPKLKLLYFGHLMWTADSLEKSLMLERLRGEGEEGVRGWDGWMASPRQRTWTWANSKRWWGTGRPGVAAVHGVAKSWMTLWLKRTLIFKGFLGAQTKESAYDLGDLGLIPEMGRSLGEGNGYPLQYSCLDNSRNREAWQAAIHGVPKSWTRLSDKCRHTETHPSLNVPVPSYEDKVLSAYNFKTNTSIFKIQLVLVIKGMFFII